MWKPTIIFIDFLSALPVLFTCPVLNRSLLRCCCCRYFHYVKSSCSYRLLLAMAGSLFSRKFVPEVYHVFVQVLSKYANLSLNILCCRIHDTDFPTIFLNWLVDTILYNFSFISAVDQINEIWSVNLVLPWCNRLPLISSIFCFFKFAEWAEVCRTRMSSRKRITRTSLGLRLVLIQFFRGHTDIFQSP